MNYNRIYAELIIRAKRRTILKGNYKEKHHIIPRSMGGTNVTWNIVDLFPEEHLLAHLLLVKMYPENEKLIYAANMLTNFYKVGNKQYKMIKERFSILQSALKMGKPNYAMCGENNPTKRPEVREKMRKPKSDQGRRNIREAIRKQDRTKENNAFYGRNHSKENMIKMVTTRKNNNGGNYHPNGNRTAKTFIFTSPTGEIFEIFNNAVRFCISKNINWNIIRKYIGEKYYIRPNVVRINERTRNSVGWSVIEKKD